jgi:antitoxin HicB
MRYPVTITPDDDQYSVTFPDVPGAVTFGVTREEALQRAQDALLTLFDAYMKDRREIPSPSVGTAGSAVEIPALDCAKIELYRAMREAHVGKAELAKRLDWHLPQVDRVLKMHHGSQLDQMEAAFAALGKRLVIAVEDQPRPTRPSSARLRTTRLMSSAKQARPPARAPRPSSAQGSVRARSGATRTATSRRVGAGQTARVRTAAKKR